MLARIACCTYCIRCSLDARSFFRVSAYERHIVLTILSMVHCALDKSDLVVTWNWKCDSSFCIRIFLSDQPVFMYKFCSSDISHSVFYFSPAMYLYGNCCLSWVHFFFRVVRRRCCAKTKIKTMAFCKITNLLTTYFGRNSTTKDEHKGTSERKW